MTILSVTLLHGSDFICAPTRVLNAFNHHKKNKPSSFETEFGWFDSIKWSKERASAIFTLKQKP